MERGETERKAGFGLARLPARGASGWLFAWVPGVWPRLLGGAIELGPVAPPTTPVETARAERRQRCVPGTFGLARVPDSGIDRRYYLSVLSSLRATMPSIYEIVNPAGTGTVVGFGVPLAQNPKGLRRPLERGAHAVASRDRETVLKMLILSRGKAGYDPEAFAQSQQLAVGADPSFSRGCGRRGRSRNSRLSRTTRRGLPRRSTSSCRPPPRRSQRGRRRGPHRAAVPAASPGGPLRPRRPPGGRARPRVCQHSRSPEREFITLRSACKDSASRSWNFPDCRTARRVRGGTVLLVLCQRVPARKLHSSGERFGPFEVREGGFDRGLWEGVPVLELLPPTAMTAGDALRGLNLEGEGWVLGCGCSLWLVILSAATARGPSPSCRRGRRQEHSGGGRGPLLRSG